MGLAGDRESEMRVLVVYGSQLGSTRAIAERMASKIGEAGIDVVTRPAGDPGELVGYDAFVIGSGVYGGHWKKDAAEFVRRYRTVLSSPPVWLFSSGPVGKLATEHPPVEPKEIGELRRITSARDHRVFFGALDRTTIDASDLGLVDRVVAKTMIPEGDYRNWDDIEGWAAGIARELLQLAAVRR
jgi:menaquinone-dependent protoporphyrinogen oxidase